MKKILGFSALAFIGAILLRLYGVVFHSNPEMYE